MASLTTEMEDLIREIVREEIAAHERRVSLRVMERFRETWLEVLGK